ncbi:nitrilase-related carbon-nitrogen hydrolase [Thermodesulfobacteriota bacterium]
MQGHDPDTVMMRGGSCIINPFGKILAGPEYGRESILFANIDLDEIARGKYDMDVAGHYARPDVFRLHVNESPMPAVVRHIRSDTDPFQEP